MTKIQSFIFQIKIQINLTTGWVAICLQFPQHVQGEIRSSVANT
jgi:hypothetical protein